MQRRNMRFFCRKKKHKKGVKITFAVCVWFRHRPTPRGQFCTLNIRTQSTHTYYPSRTHTQSPGTAREVSLGRHTKKYEMRAKFTLCRTPQPLIRRSHSVEMRGCNDGREIYHKPTPRHDDDILHSSQ